MKARDELRAVGAASLELRLSRAIPISPADIDECGTEMAHCRANQYCVNTEGSYECRGQGEVGVFYAGGSSLLVANPGWAGKDLQQQPWLLSLRQIVPRLASAAWVLGQLAARNATRATGGMEPSAWVSASHELGEPCCFLFTAQALLESCLSPRCG